MRVQYRPCDPRVPPSVLRSFVPRRRSYGIVNRRTSRYICRTGGNTSGDSRSPVVSLKFKFARNRASFGITLIAGVYVTWVLSILVQYVRAGHQKIQICSVFNVGRSWSQHPSIRIAHGLHNGESRFSRRSKKKSSDLSPLVFDRCSPTIRVGRIIADRAGVCVASSRRETASYIITSFPSFTS